MTQAPATGLYGPGDFPEDFVTIDGAILLEDLSFRQCRNDLQSAYEDDISRRSATVTALITLAHDLDARGLVLMSEDEIEDRICDALMEGAVQGYSDGCERY